MTKRAKVDRRSTPRRQLAYRQLGTLLFSALLLTGHAHAEDTAHEDTAPQMGPDEPAAANETDDAAEAVHAEDSTAPARADSDSGDETFAPRAATPSAAGGLPEAARPRMDVSVHPSEGLRTGDLLTLRVVADAAEGDDLTLPNPRLGSMELVDQRLQIDPAAEGRKRFVFELELLVLEPGTQQIPELSFRVVTRDGSVGSVTVPPQAVTVGSWIANEPDAQPQQPTTPVVVWQDDYTLLWILAALLALVAVVLVTLLVRRWWLRRKPLAPPPPPRPAGEVALEKLDELRRVKPALLAAGRHVELVDRASDAVREYLGAVHGFEGLERTTSELLRDLQQSAPPPALLAQVGDYLERCDLMKFAKLQPDDEEADRILVVAYDIVHAAAVPPSDPGEAAPAPGAAKGEAIGEDAR